MKETHNERVIVPEQGLPEAELQMVSFQASTDGANYVLDLLRELQTISSVSGYLSLASDIAKVLDIHDPSAKRS
jgi:hypothetical protein